MNITPQDSERAQVVIYLHKRASDHRRNRQFPAATALDDAAREIENRHHKPRRPLTNTKSPTQ